MMQGLITTGEIKRRLRIKFPAPAYALLFEVSDRAGFDRTGSADALAMSTWPSRGLDLFGFEFKASRQDWLHERANPAKSEKFIEYCDFWFLVVGHLGIVADNELPAGWGLMVPDRRGLKILVTPKRNENPKEISRTFMAAMMRRVSGNIESAVRDQVHAAEHVAVEKDRDERGGKLYRDLKEQYDLLIQNVEKFEAESGLSIRYRWEQPAAVGKTVKMVLEKTSVIERIKSDLERLRESAQRITESIDKNISDVQNT